jgi:hypothetical protein
MQLFAQAAQFFAQSTAAVAEAVLGGPNLPKFGLEWSI